MQKSYSEINMFVQVANNWLERNQGESKLRYAVSKVMKSAMKLMGEYQEQVEEVNIDNCATDDKGVILRDDKGQFRFTKEGLKARNKKINELFKSSVTIEPHFATALPSDDELSADEREIFSGFVLREQEQAEPASGLINGQAAAAGETVN